MVDELQKLASLVCVGVRNTGADGDGAHVAEAEVPDAFDDRLRRRQRLVWAVAGQKDGELVASYPESLAGLAQPCRDSRKDGVAGRVTESVVDELEVVDVDEANRQGASKTSRVFEFSPKTFVEVPVIPEPGERVGQCQAHCAQGSEKLSLVELDRE
jgi:hypothetical protein